MLRLGFPVQGTTRPARFKQAVCGDPKVEVVQTRGSRPPSEEIITAWGSLILLQKVSHFLWVPTLKKEEAEVQRSVPKQPF